MSDISSTFAPVGPTSRKSRSAGNVWRNPLIVAVTLARGVNPDTLIEDGYGSAGPCWVSLAPIMITAGLQKATAFDDAPKVTRAARSDWGLVRVSPHAVVSARASTERL